MRILGFDPGSRNLGASVIDTAPKLELITQEWVKIPKEKGNLFLYNHIKLLAYMYEPEVISMERIFFNRNINSAIAVGEIIGAIKILAQKLNIEVYTYTPQQAKNQLTGNGKATKLEIKEALEKLLNQEVSKYEHPNDATSLAICYARLEQLIPSLDQSV